ncbi:GFA family protein [Pseudaestuariivita atlantica]|uniref:Aldehyde-activating protein n=1 Tax=Pseudaestuariivita atlantica TaxID=1317121 RepID=A0A0L1JQY8_9RHOB|nr:GFA family protein [Pseudaestuariivita atlantica]KNG94151.1 aldehyde-activating protein [Pseudaestuariivita atlantica]
MTWRLICHCGAVEADVTLLPEGLASARRCDCSFCRRRGAVTVSAPLDGVQILRGEDNLTLYTWGTHTARHFFCKTCGIYVYHQRRSNPDELGVNALALHGVEPADLGEVAWLDGVNHPADRS